MQRECILIPLEDETVVFTCHDVDTHTVTVSSDGASADQTSTPPVVRSGDYNNDGRKDLAIVAHSAGTRQMGDFILENLGNGALKVVTNATSAQITAARGWPVVSGAVAVTGDITHDGKLDVLIKGLGSLIAGTSSVAVWSDPDGLTDYPTVAAALNTARRNFLSETAAAFANSNHYDNAMVERCTNYSGWVWTVVYISRPGLYNTTAGWRFIIEPGYYWARFRLVLTECQDVVDTSALTSTQAYVFYRNWRGLDGDVDDDDFEDQAARLWAILQIVFGVEVGKSAGHPPYDDLEDSEESVLAMWIWLDVLCRFYGCGAVAEGVEGVATIGITGFVCTVKYSDGEVPSSPNPFRVPKVTHPPTQNFSITTAQRTDSRVRTDAARLSFWRSRWKSSKDPLGPLGVDVVNNAHLLGCMANERLKWYAARHNRTIDLTDVGASVVEAHVGTTDGELRPVSGSNTDVGIRGKLSATQIAEYHHDVFELLGLPPRTFGGTPITGIPLEAEVTKVFWCRSCDE